MQEVENAGRGWGEDLLQNINQYLVKLTSINSLLMVSINFQRNSHAFDYFFCLSAWVEAQAEKAPKASSNVKKTTTEFFSQHTRSNTGMSIKLC